MNAPIRTNCTTSVTPEEQHLLEQLRQLPPGADREVEEYMTLLAARAANPGSPDAATPARTAEQLASEAFLKIVRRLPPADAELIWEFAIFIAGRSMKWSYDDPESVARAAELMGLDPFLLREVNAINKEFACTIGDGLEDY